MSLIVALIDFSDKLLAEDVICASQRLAKLMQARLYMLHAESPSAKLLNSLTNDGSSRQAVASQLRNKRRAMRILEAAAKHLGVETRSMMVRSLSSRPNPAAKLLQELTRLQPDMVVVGSHGYGPLYQLFRGSVSETIIRHSSSPVLVIPSSKKNPKPDRSRSGDADSAGAVNLSLVTIR